MQDLALKPWQIHRPTFDEKSKPEHSIYFSGAAVVPKAKQLLTANQRKLELPENEMGAV